MKQRATLLVLPSLDSELWYSEMFNFFGSVFVVQPKSAEDLLLSTIARVNMAATPSVLIITRSYSTPPLKNLKDHGLTGICTLEQLRVRLLAIALNISQKEPEFLSTRVMIANRSSRLCLKELEQTTLPMVWHDTIKPHSSNDPQSQLKVAKKSQCRVTTRNGYIIVPSSAISPIE